MSPDEDRIFGNDAVLAPRTAASGHPLIAGMFPDPTICRFGDYYVLAHSSFEYAPAIPIWTSTDLIHWNHVGNALDRPSQLRLQPMTRWLDGSDIDENDLPVGSANTGTFAPTIRAHAGRLWLAVTNISDFQGGPLVFHADNPAGPWSDPVQAPRLPGIDPDLFWDDVGTAHLTVSSYEGGGPHVTSAAVDLASGALLSEPRRLWSGTGGQAPESPHLFHHAGWLYLLLAEGGTERGHAVTVARARDFDGPWESNPSNPILTHRGLDRPVLNVGHADLVRTPAGEWAMVYLGVRPRGFSGFHVNGRETFLAGVDWTADWPIVDEERYSLPPAEHSFIDEFTTASLDPRWVAPGRLPGDFVRPEPGGLLIEAPSGSTTPHLFLATRPRDPLWRAELTLTVEARAAAALTLRVDQRHAVEVVVSQDRVESVVHVGGLERRNSAQPASGREPVTVYIQARAAAGPALLLGPDVIEVGVVEPDGGDLALDQIDGRYISVEVAGGWTGRMVGPRAVRGRAHIHRFSYVADSLSKTS